MRVPRTELALIALLGGVAVCAIGFCVAYALDGVPHQTQYLGLALGLAFLFAAAACAVVARAVLPDEPIEGDYPPERHEADVAGVAQLLSETGQRFTRKRLLLLAGGGAATALGAALIAPLLSLGTPFDLAAFTKTPWRRGRRLVGDDGKPLRAHQIVEGTFYTAYPQGADREQLGAPLVVVRLPAGSLHLPEGRRGWAPGGIVAYSKICTHAGCAVALYRKPLFPPVEPGPALVCPCHYSTFDPATGGTVLAGPAGRPLPQLPLEIAADGTLRAAGNFSGPVGPAWWGVRSRKAT